MAEHKTKVRDVDILDRLIAAMDNVTGKTETLQKTRDSLHGEISKYLKGIRERNSYTQEDLAKALGFSKSYMCELEKGVKQWPKKHLEKLKKILTTDGRKTS